MELKSLPWVERVAAVSDGLDKALRKLAPGTTVDTRTIADVIAGGLDCRAIDVSNVLMKVAHAIPEASQPAVVINGYGREVRPWVWAARDPDAPPPEKLARPSVQDERHAELLAAIRAISAPAAVEAPKKVTLGDVMHFVLNSPVFSKATQDSVSSDYGDYMLKELGINA